jgi:hypothetical protein
MPTVEDVVRVMNDYDERYGPRENPIYLFATGACAFFVPLGDGWGWKGFWDENNPHRPMQHKRAYNYHVSKIFHEIGIGAEIGEMADVPFKDDVYKGYFMREAEILWEYAEEHNLSPEDTKKHVEDLYTRAHAADRVIKMGDMHDDNLGFIDGRLVVIDVSHSDTPW